MALKVLGICGGAGVILHPFRNRLLGNIEQRAIFGTPNDVQWHLNFTVGFDSSVVDYGRNKVDVIVGAPDCGHSSMFAYSRAKRLSNPGDNASLKFYIEQVQYYKPKVFLMENLAKLMETMGDELDRVFEDYRLLKFVESVASWGNSQVTRLRLVLVGVRKDLNPEILRHIQLPDLRGIPLKYEGELLKGLNHEPIPELCHVREPDDWTVCMHYKEDRKITVAKARELWMTEYADIKKWPASHGNMVNQPGVYRNFENDYPLTVRKQSRQFNHDGYMMSPRELARIQGIPDTFKLWYDPKGPMYCINKARAAVAKTPPYEIGAWFNEILTKIEKYL